MSSIPIRLAEELSSVQRPGDFFAFGTAQFLAPHLEVEGVGPIAFPLLEAQAGQLIAAAQQAPYGRGEETLVDTEVRRTWQIDADRIRIEGKHWERTLESIVARVAEGLGVAGAVAADLYKLLVYGAGSFFVSHRDTEKVPGMFATLVIVLPSIYGGGKLIVRHRDREARLNLCSPDPAEIAYAAFYADCVHEVLPVTSGCRLTLIYNLRHGDNGQAPTVPDYGAECSRVTELLRDWCAGKSSPEDDTPEKLIYPLEHAYTPAELSFETLKGADAAVATVFTAAAEQAGCELHLALVTIEESGSAEHAGYYRSRRGRWSDEEDDEFEVEEVFDRNLFLSEWRTPGGNRPEMGRFPFKETELCPPAAFEELQPDKLHFHEATGNEGASFERSYSRAGLVLWPRVRRLAVFNQAGLSLTLPYLEELASHWEESGDGRESPLWCQARELAGHMLRTWPREAWHYRPGAAPGETAEMLAILTRLQDTAHIDAFLAELSAQGVYGKGDNPALIRAMDLLPSPRAAELIGQVIAGNAATHLSACGDLLARATAARGAGSAPELTRAAGALLKALPGQAAQPVPSAPWQRTTAVEPAFIVDLLTALGQIDMALAEHAADHILAWPAVYGLDAVLVPAVLRLIETDPQQARKNSAALKRLHAACLQHLSARAAEPLEPPRDWTRASDIGCRCDHCDALSRFLADPGREVWTFKAAEAQRSHVEHSIRTSGSDLKVSTDTRGRPYTLVCTKNQASYDRRARQREKDLDALARLEAHAR